MLRRDLLRAGAVSLPAALAGCSQIDGLLGDSDSTPSGWSTFRGDPARTGVRPAEVGPGESPSEGWTLTTRDLLSEFHDVEPEELPLTPTTPYLSWPVTTDDHVLWTVGYTWYGPDAEERNRALRLVAADPADGSIAWSLDLGALSGTEGPLPVEGWFGPEVDGDRVHVPYLYDGVGVAILDAASGDVERQLDLGLSTLSGQPLVADGTIYVAESASSGRGTLHAVDAGSGDTEWTVPSDSVRPSWPGLTLADGSLWSFDRIDGRAVVARDAGNGSELAREPVELPDQFATNAPGVLAAPTVAHGNAYAAGSLEQLVRRDVSPLVSFDADSRERWRYEPPGLEGADNPIARFDPDITQEEIAALPPFSAMYGYPLSLDGHVLATGAGDPDGASGEVEHLFAVDEADGTLEWSLPVGSTTFAPVAAGDVVYLVTVDGVEAISTDGRRVGEVALDANTRVEYPPALGFGRLFVPTLRGVVALE